MHFNFKKIVKNYYHKVLINYIIKTSEKLYNNFNGHADLNPTVKADGLVFKQSADEDLFKYLTISFDQKKMLMAHNSLLDNKIYVYPEHILLSVIEKDEMELLSFKKIKFLNAVIINSIIHELSHSEQSGYSYLKTCRNKDDSIKLVESQNFANYSKFIENNFEEINSLVATNKDCLTSLLFNTAMLLDIDANAEFVRTKEQHKHIKSIIVQSLLRLNYEQGSNDDCAIDIINWLDNAKNITFIVNNIQYDVVVNGKETKKAIELKEEVDKILMSYFKYDNDILYIYCKS